MLLNRHAAGGGSSPATFIAGENLVEGDLVVLDTAGEVVRASNTFVGGNWRVLGVTRESASASSSVRVSLAGSLEGVRFASPPPSGSNGAHVWLSAVAGEATVSPPTGTGTVVYVVGVLQGADGVATTVSVVIQPQYIARIP